MAKARIKRLQRRAQIFCDAKLKGATNISAWRAATIGWEAMGDDSQRSQCYKFSHLPQVEELLAAQTAQASVEQVDNHVRQHVEIMEDQVQSRELGDMKAVAALHRVRQLSGGWASETFSLMDSSMSDAKLMQRIAELAPATAAELMRNPSVVNGLTLEHVAAPMKLVTNNKR